MIKILFICHGNICRSPIAEFIMKDKVSKRGLGDHFLIESCATSTEEIGNSVYPAAQRILKQHGISCKGKTARQITSSDYEKFDYLITMESYNTRNLKRIIPFDPGNKIHRLLDYTGIPKDISDPWYSGDFETAYREIEYGCEALLNTVIKNKKD